MQGGWLDQKLERVCKLERVRRGHRRKTTMEAGTSEIRASLGGRAPVDFVALEDGAELVLQTEGHGEGAVVGGLTKRPPVEGGDTSTTERCSLSPAHPVRQPLPNQGCYQTERSHPEASPPGTPADTSTREESSQPHCAPPALYELPHQDARHQSHIARQSRLQQRSDRREQARAGLTASNLRRAVYMAREGLGHSTRNGQDLTDKPNQTEFKFKQIWVPPSLPPSPALLGSCSQTSGGYLRLS